MMLQKKTKGKRDAEKKQCGGGVMQGDVKRPDKRSVAP
jgi:hypothetical protein